MSLLSTTYCGSQNNEVNLAIRFNASNKNGQTKINALVYKADPNDGASPLITWEYEFPSGIISIPVDNAHENINLKGTLRLEGNVVSFEGDIVLPRKVRICFQYGIVASF